MGFQGTNAKDLVKHLEVLAEVLPNGKLEGETGKIETRFHIQNLHNAVNKVPIQMQYVAALLKAIDKLPSPTMTKKAKDKLKEAVFKRMQCRSQRDPIQFHFSCLSTVFFQR